MKACLLFAAVLAWSAFTLHAQEAGAPVLHSLGAAHSAIDDCPVTFGRVLDSWVNCRGHNYGMDVLVDPADAATDRMFLLSKWIEAHVIERLDMLHVEFFTDMKAYEIKVKPLRETTDEELDYMNAHWAGCLHKNAWTHNSDFIFLHADGDPESIPLHPEVKPTGGPAYIPPEFKD